MLAVAAVCVGKFRVLSKQLKYLAALYIWFLFFSSLPHKEERRAWPNPIVFIVTSGVVTLTWLPQLIPAGLQFYRRHQSERGVSDSA